MCCSSRGLKELDTTEQLNKMKCFSFHVVLSNISPCSKQVNTLVVEISSLLVAFFQFSTSTPLLDIILDDGPMDRTENV